MQCLPRVSNPRSKFHGCLADSKGEVLRFDPDNGPTPQAGGKAVQLTFKALPHHSAQTNGAKGNTPIQIKNEHELSRLYLQEFYRKELDCNISKVDPGGLIRVLKGASCFSSNLQALAEEVREVRNRWAHAVLSEWDIAKFEDAFSSMEKLAVMIPNNANLLLELTEDKNKELVEKKELQKLKEVQLKCDHCGKTKEEYGDTKELMCSCCNFLLCCQLIPKASAEDDLDILLGQVCEQLAQNNTPSPKHFFQIKEEFLKENYPNLQEGCHVHPEMFIPRSKPAEFLDPSEQPLESLKDRHEMMLYDFIRKQFQHDNCFIFHNLKNGLDIKVISHYCDSLYRKFALGECTETDVFTNLSIVSKLVFLNWTTIEKEIEDMNIPINDREAKMTEIIKSFKTHLENKSEESDFFLVSQSLTSVLHFDLHPASTSKKGNKIIEIKKYLEALCLPNARMLGMWNFIGFVVQPDKTPHSDQTSLLICDGCDNHIIWKSDMENNDTFFYERVKTIISKETEKVDIVAKVKIVRHFDDEKAKIQNQYEKKCYERLISNIVIMSSMEMLSDYGAVGKVMSRLVGSESRVVGPGDPKLLLWNKSQKTLLDNPKPKVIISSDFGCGKSLLLHRHIQNCSMREPANNDNFLISFYKVQLRRFISEQLWRFPTSKDTRIRMSK